jgi:hypothetical protein
MSQSATAESAVNTILNKQEAQAKGLDTLKRDNERSVGLMQAVQTGNAIQLEISRGQQLLQTLQAQVAAAQLAQIADSKQRDINLDKRRRAVLNYNNPNLIDSKTSYDPAPLNFNVKDAQRPKTSW